MVNHHLDKDNRGRANKVKASKGSLHSDRVNQVKDNRQVSKGKANKVNHRASKVRKMDRKVKVRASRDKASKVNKLQLNKGKASNKAKVSRVKDNNKPINKAQVISKAHKPAHPLIVKMKIFQISKLAAKRNR